MAKEITITSVCPICGSDDFKCSPEEPRTWNHPGYPGHVECQKCGHILEDFDYTEEEDGPEGGFSDDE